MPINECTQLLHIRWPGMYLLSRCLAVGLRDKLYSLNDARNWYVVKTVEGKAEYYKYFYIFVS
jgi:hypothetical protein